MAKVLHTSLLLWADGMALTPGLILLHPARAADTALIAHEETHCRQMREVGTLTFWWRYVTDSAFRLQVEVEAYRVQIALAPWMLERAALGLATRYCLDVTVDEARALLTQEAAP